MSFGASLQIARGRFRAVRRTQGAALVASLPPAPVPVRFPDRRERAADAHEGRPPPGRRRRASARAANPISPTACAAPFRTKGDARLRLVQQRPPSPPGAAGDPATYPMVRRADPRVGRACAPATQGARLRVLASRSARSFIPRRAAEREAEQIAPDSFSSRTRVRRSRGRVPGWRSGVEPSGFASPRFFRVQAGLHSHRCQARDRFA